MRRQALAHLAAYTKRNAVLYASGHLQKSGAPANLLSITHEDIEGFMEVVYGLPAGGLDLILHSPGGSPEATEAIVSYLRSLRGRLADLRVIVPHEAMSAATLLACAADRIVMGRHSYLGPVDPQLQIGQTLVPAQAILSQFERAKRECLANSANLAVWVPVLQQYAPALLEQCENAIALSQELVATWLRTWMLQERPDGEERAKAIAKALTDHGRLRTHGRPLGRDYLRQLGLRIDDLEGDQELQDRVLTVYHAAMHTFSGTPAAKIIENQQGRAFIKLFQMVVVPSPGASPPPSSTVPLAPA